MIEIVINGKKQSLEENINIDEMLKKLDYKHNAFAVALNGTFVSLVEYENQKIKANDIIEILAPMQGG